jgi:hypothetical protein
VRTSRVAERLRGGAAGVWLAQATLDWPGRERVAALKLERILVIASGNTIERGRSLLPQSHWQSSDADVSGVPSAHALALTRAFLDT